MAPDGVGWYGAPVPATTLPPAIRDEIERLGRADIMVGIPSFKNAATIGYVVRAAQAGLVQYFPDLRPLVVNADAGSPDGTQRVVVESEPPEYIERILLVRPTNRLSRISLTYPEVDGIGGKGAALRTIFEIAAALEVQALVVVDSDLRSIVPEWIELLAGPILKGGYDFVAPLYARYKYDGTITNTVTYPLTRALYGRRIRQPIGGDFGVSGDLVRHYLEAPDWTEDVSRFGIDIWMTTTALTGGFAVCQTRLGAKVHDPKDPGSDLGPMFRQVVGTILRLAIASPDSWLPIKGSHDVPAYGFERIMDPPPLEVNTIRLLSEFHQGSLALAAGMVGDALADDIRDGHAPRGRSRSARRVRTAATGNRRGRGRQRARRGDASSHRRALGGRRVIPFPGRCLGPPRLRPRRRGKARTRRDPALRGGARPDLLRSRRQPHHRIRGACPPTRPRSGSSARPASSSF